MLVHIFFEGRGTFCIGWTCKKNTIYKNKPGDAKKKFQVASIILLLIWKDCTHSWEVRALGLLVFKHHSLHFCLFWHHWVLSWFMDLLKPKIFQKFIILLTKHKFTHSWEVKPFGLLVFRRSYSNNLLLLFGYSVFSSFQQSRGSRGCSTNTSVPDSFIHSFIHSFSDAFPPNIYNIINPKP